MRVFSSEGWARDDVSMAEQRSGNASQNQGQREGAAGKVTPSPWGEGRGEGDRDIRTAWSGLKRGVNELRCNIGRIASQTGVAGQ